MWTKRGRARLALSISLWALAGVALVFLPGLLAQTSSKTTTPDNPAFPGLATPSAARTTVTNTTSQNTNPGSNSDFILKLVFILIPALAFSVVVRTWATRRVRREAF